MDNDNLQTLNKVLEKSGSQQCNKTSLSVLVEPTSSCNLDCIYCYKGDKPNKTMSFDILESMLQKVISYNETRKMSSSFVWHGGEPTMVGVKFYEKAFKYIESLDCKHKVSHTLQTNGTLLTDELLDLFAEYKVSLGVSLDGPAEYHNSMRPSRNGGHTHEKVLNGIQRAKAKEIEVGLLMSITNDNSMFIKEMFEYARQSRFTFGLNPVTADLHSPHSEIEVTPENYLKACIEVFDLWFYQKDYSVQVNPGFGVTRLLLSKSRLSDCLMSENCQMHFISIGPEGDIYPCNRFYGVGEYKLGNIEREDFEKIMNSPKRKYLLDRSASKIDECKYCSISQYCNGGCMHHAVVHNGSLYSPDHLCLVYRGLVEHALKRLDQELH